MRKAKNLDNELLTSNVGTNNYLLNLLIFNLESLKCENDVNSSRRFYLAISPASR